ncbi:unnamed protein product, partial [Rotaria sp. Silwood1]
QLEQEQSNNQYISTTTYYRGKCMSDDELKSLQESYNLNRNSLTNTCDNFYIIANTFFSTTSNRQTALAGFSGQITKMIRKNLYIAIEDDFSSDNSYYFEMQSEYGYQSVLFEIQVDPDSTYPYANISHMSELPWEDETLFAIGSIFQIINIEYSEQGYAFIIKIRLINKI